jgi:acyl-CoA thioester hydrolase
MPIDPAALPQNPALTVPVDVFYFDTDAGGVVHNVAYLRMVEMARSKLAEHLGWTLKEMNETGYVPVVARTEIDYLKPAKLGDKIQIDARLARLEKVRFHLEFTLRRAESDFVFARCSQVMVPVQLPSGRPRPVPEEWIRKYSNS